MERKAWPEDLGWVIDALGFIPADVTSMTLKGKVEMERWSCQRLQAAARSATLFTYRDVVVTFASPPVATERERHHSDMMPPRFSVALELTVRKG